MKTLKIVVVALTLSTIQACALLMPSPDKLVSMIMEKCDTSGDDQISRIEGSDCDDESASAIDEFFKKHDKDRNGFISRSELAAEVRKKHG